ncbi:MAG: tetratricopeptide repeat protein [Planctomycetota bacterium]
MKGLLSLGLLFFSAAVFAAPEVSDEARRKFDVAEVAREQGKLKIAAESYKEAITASPFYWDAHSGYLSALRGLDDYAESSEFYARLLKAHQSSLDLKVYAAAAQVPAKAYAALKELNDDYQVNTETLRISIEFGRAAVLAGESRTAEKALKAALKVKEDSLTARTLLGDLYLHDGKHAKARKEYEANLELDSSHIPSLIRVNICWHRAKKSDKAIEGLTKLVAEENLPELVAAHWTLCLIYTELGRIDDAIKTLDAVLAIHKENPPALIAKGQLLLDKELPMEAVKVFAVAVELTKSPLAHFCLAWAYEVGADAPEVDEAKRTERLTAAAEQYAKAARGDPGARPRDSLGFMLLRLGEHRDAITQFKRARDIDPQFATASNNLGLASDMADNTSEAMKRYNTVLAKIEKKNLRAIVSLGLDYWLQGRMPKAIKKFKEALKIDPKDDLIYTFMGDVHYDNKKLKDAIRAYKKAVAINPKNFTAWFHMGIAYDVDKKTEDAKDAYKAALDAKPDPPADLWRRYGWVNLDLKEYDEALKAFKEYLQMVGSDETVEEVIKEIEEANK